jgi:GST-like protein
MNSHRLLGCQGCGNVIVEAAFAFAGVPLELEEVDYAADSPTRARLLQVNPLGQVPTLVLPEGTILTESLAIVHYLNDLEPGAQLVPPPGDPQRKIFFRWSVFLVAAVYPTFTYGDEPTKWVADEKGAKQLKESSNRHREAMWMLLEGEARGPWFLGERMSALDLYLAVMTHWRPGALWFAKHTPRIVEIAKRAAALPAVAPVIDRHFS